MISKKELEKRRNEDAYKMLISEVNNRLEKIYQGGGVKKIAKQHEKGKLTARERIDHLIDKNSNFLEIGAFAG